MKLLTNTLSVLHGVWRDPGESLCGAGPALAKCDVVEEVIGQVEIECASIERACAILVRQTTIEDAYELNLLLADCVPPGIIVDEWYFNAAGKIVTATVNRFRVR